MMLRRRRPQVDDDSKKIEIGSKRIHQFMNSMKGIGVIVGIAIILFSLSVFLYNLFGDKPVIYLACFVGSVLFFARDLIGGKKIEVKGRY